MYKKGHNIYLKTIKDEIWVIKEGNKIFNLNQTAALILRYLLKGYKLRDMKEKLHKEYGVHREKLEHDINALIKKLESESIIRKVI